MPHMTVDNAPNRRQFLRFLAGSPVVALTGLPALAGESVSSPADLPARQLESAANAGSDQESRGGD